MACICSVWNCVCYKEPHLHARLHVDVQPVGQVMFPYQLFDAEIISCEWTWGCISRSIQIDMSVTNHARIFDRASVGELCAIIKRGGRLLL